MAEIMPHIQLGEKQAASYALLPGDPGRLDRIASYLEDVEELAFNREFRSIKGKFQGITILAVSTGIGGASAAIAVEELSKIGVKAMIRIGSCGALQKGISLGELIIANGAVRQDGASAAYADLCYPAIPDTELLNACIQSAEEKQFGYKVGIVRSHDSFYTDQEEEIRTYWSEKGILGSDMETAALFVAGRIRKIMTASILNTVVEYEESLEDNINRYTDGDAAMVAGEEAEILTALLAFVQVDKKRRMKDESII